MSITIPGSQRVEMDGATALQNSNPNDDSVKKAMLNKLFTEHESYVKVMNQCIEAAAAVPLMLHCEAAQLEYWLTSSADEIENAIRATGKTVLVQGQPEYSISDANSLYITLPHVRLCISALKQKLERAKAKRADKCGKENKLQLLSSIPPFRSKNT